MSACMVGLVEHDLSSSSLFLLMISLTPLNVGWCVVIKKSLFSPVVWTTIAVWRPRSGAISRAPIVVARIAAEVVIVAWAVVRVAIVVCIVDVIVGGGSRVGSPMVVCPLLGWCLGLAVPSIVGDRNRFADKVAAQVLFEDRVSKVELPPGL